MSLLQVKQGVRAIAIAVIAATTTVASAAEQRLEQVLVSAKRISEDASRLPLAWSAVDEGDLTLIGHTHPNEIMQQVPGSWISRGNGQESLTALRSPVLTGAGGCGSFFMAADGISLRAPGFCNVNQLFDANIEQASRIEVIKGPAGATYGSNAMHGVINVLGAEPKPGAGQQLALESGPDDYFRGKYRLDHVQGRHGVSLRLNGTMDGGYQEESGFDQQKLTLRHDYDGAVWSFQTVVDAANLNQETAGFVQGFKAYADNTLRTSNPNPEAYRDAWSLRLYSQASRELNNGQRLSITPYLRRNRMEFLQHFVPWQPVETNGHESLGLRTSLHGEAGGLSWVAGTDLEYTDGWLREEQENPFSPNQPEGIHYDYEVAASMGAAYTQLRYAANERWTLDGGVRLEYTHYDYDNLAEDGPACTPAASACRFFRVADRRDRFTDWSVNAGASLQLRPDHYAYLRLANGFRAPDTSELYRLQSGQAVADLDSEVIDNIELGLRGNTGGGLSYDLSVYHMNKDEVIFQDADRRNVSGAKTEHYGLEMSLDYRSQGSWYTRLDVTAARHRYANNALPLGVNDPIDGNDIDTAPRLFGSARFGWEFAPRYGTAPVAELEWVYMDEYYLEPENRFKYEGHSLLNLRLSSPLTPQLAASLRITNLLDEDYAERADVGFGQYRYFVGRPRGAFVELRYSWGKG
ncbi:MAG: TonB-dependent receptor [Haliea sp.]|uniref:TonB-dependent receptor n=1 Tax=Haliea sp. TaxID=1932666 RepID=UPI0032EDCA96